MIFTDKDFDEFVGFIGEQESQEIRGANEYADAVALMAEFGDEQRGELLCWSNTHDKWRLRFGELTIWAGINGHGKSLMLGEMIMHRLKHEIAVIASLEMKPEQTLFRMACQYAGCAPAVEFARKVINRMEGKLWIYDQLDTVAPERILGMVHYAAVKLKAKHVVIDSLMKCGIAEDDFKSQKTFVDRLQWAAKRYDIHVHLVCHMRKKESENHKPNKMDIKGTGAITDIADNVFIVSRNKRKEEIAQLQKIGKPLIPKELEILDQCDAYLTIDKNRHGGTEGIAGFYFHKESGRYTSTQRISHTQPEAF